MCMGKANFKGTLELQKFNLCEEFIPFGWFLVFCLFGGGEEFVCVCVFVGFVFGFFKDIRIGYS